MSDEAIQTTDESSLFDSDDWAPQRQEAADEVGGAEEPAGDPDGEAEEPVETEEPEEGKEEKPEPEPEPEEKPEPKEKPEPEGEEKPEAKKEPEEEYDNDFDVEIETVVNGKAQKETLPLKRLVQSFQKEKASHERFEAAAERQKAVDRAMAYFKQDPIRVLEEMLTHDFGGTPEARQKARQYRDALIRKHHRALEEEAALPPEEKERRRLEQELESLRTEKQRLEAARQKEEEDAALQSFRERRSKEIRDAIKGLEGRFQDARITLDTELAHRVDALMWQWKDRGVEISAQDAAEEILREREYALERYLKTATPEEIAARWPEISQANGKKALAEAKKREAEELEADSVPKSDRKARSKNTPQEVYRDFDEIREAIAAERRR